MTKIKAIFNNAGTPEILIYGAIGMYNDVSALGFVNELRNLENQYNEINVRINSVGGEVFEGITIMNAIKSSKANITIYIDGLAASMGSIIASCGRPVYMSKYARFMMHRVSGVAIGHAGELRSTADMMESLEETLQQVYSDKSGIAVDEIKTKYFDGKDHWLTADEALAMKVINGIYDGSKIDMPADMNNIYNMFQSINQTLFSNNLNQENDMKTIALKLGLNENATEAEILAAIAKMQSENVTATTENKILGDQLKLANKAKIEALLNDGVKAGKFTAEQKPQFQNLCEKDFDSTRAIIDAMAPAIRPNNLINLGTGSHQAQGTTSKWDEVAAQGMKALESWKDEDPTAYKAAYKAKYGIDYKEPKE